MNDTTKPNTCKLFDLPLGSWFRYAGTQDTYVFLGHQDSGLIGDSPDRCRRVAPMRLFQGMYSAAESRAEFEALMVEHVPVRDADSVDELLASLVGLLEGAESTRLAEGHYFTEEEITAARAVVAKFTASGS